MLRSARPHPAFAFLDPSVLLATITLAGLFVWGCQSTHPDDKSAVYAALTQNKLDSVVVAQDREKGVIRLSGIVGNSQSKAQAQAAAQQAAPGYAVQNDIQVQDTGLMQQANPKDTLDPGSATTMPSH